jgi:HIV Tat-specific factor 1
MKHMFDPEDAKTDISFYDDLKEEIEAEVKKLGPVNNVKIFERNPEGVVAVKFSEQWAAEKCIQVMNGRFFGGKKIEVDFYDGWTDYYVPEKEEDQAARDKRWEEFLTGEKDISKRDPTTEPGSTDNNNAAKDEDSPHDD